VDDGTPLESGNGRHSFNGLRPFLFQDGDPELDHIPGVTKKVSGMLERLENILGGWK